MSAMASCCITQCAMFCSMYCSVMPLKMARCGSAWKKQAEMPIFNIGDPPELLHRFRKNPLEVLARTRSRIGLMAGIVDRHIDQRGDVGLGHRSFRFIGRERRRNR